MILDLIPCIYSSIFHWYQFNPSRMRIVHSLSSEKRSREFLPNIKIKTKKAQLKLYFYTTQSVLEGSATSERRKNIPSTRVYFEDGVVFFRGLKNIPSNVATLFIHVIYNTAFNFSVCSNLTFVSATINIFTGNSTLRTFALLTEQRP